MNANPVVLLVSAFVLAVSGAKLPAVPVVDASSAPIVDELVITETILAPVRPTVVPAVRPTVVVTPPAPKDLDPLPIAEPRVVAVADRCVAGDCPAGACASAGACGKGDCGAAGSCGSDARGGPVRRVLGGVRDGDGPVRRVFRGRGERRGRLFGRGGCAGCG